MEARRKLLADLGAEAGAELRPAHAGVALQLAEGVTHGRAREARVVDGRKGRVP